MCRHVYISDRPQLVLDTAQCCSAIELQAAASLATCTQLSLLMQTVMQYIVWKCLLYLRKLRETDGLLVRLIHTWTRSG